MPMPVRGGYPVSVEVSQEWTTGWMPVTEGFLGASVGTLPILGPTVVPGNSIYSYFVPLLGQVVNPANPWTITTDPVVGAAAAAAAAAAAPKILLWGKSFAPFGGKLMPALFADIQFSNAIPVVATISVKGSLFNILPITFKTNVDVVRVITSVNSATRNTVLAPIAGRLSIIILLPLRVAGEPQLTYVLRHYYGDDVGAFTFTGRTLGAEDTIVVRTRAGAFQTRVSVTLSPPLDAPAGVITNIQVGLIQSTQESGFAFVTVHSPASNTGVGRPRR
jgi:hypothetical protein